MIKSTEVLPSNVLTGLQLLTGAKTTAPDEVNRTSKNERRRSVHSS